jgi:hypothetical protein
MQLTRRALLASLAAGLAVRPRATAGADRPCHLLIVTALGGWDVTFAFDPKPGVRGIDGPEVDEDADNPEDREAVTTFAGIPVMTNPHKRPKVSRFFERWAERALVLNGVSVGTIAHTEAQVRMLTGAIAAGRADVGMISGATLGAARPVPYMDLGGAGFTGPLAALSGRAGRSGQLANLLDRRRPLKGPGELSYPQYHPSDADADAISAWLAEAEARQQAALGGWGRGAHRLEDWTEARGRADALLADGRRLANGLAAARTLRSQADVALDMLTSGLSHSLLLDSGGLWDTHLDNSDQHGLYNDLFAGLDHLLDGLDAAGLLDHTVVLVLSEMSRSAKRNSSGGKDHWSATSALLLGGPVAGGRVIGATADSLAPLPLNLASGARDDGGLVPRYDHLAAGVLQLLDVDPGEWLPGVTPLGGLRG